MRDHKDLIINILIDELSGALSRAAFSYSHHQDGGGLLHLDQSFDFVDSYISSLPGGHNFVFFDLVFNIINSKDISEEEKFNQFTEFFKNQIKMHIREEIRAMGDEKVDGDVGKY